MQSVVKLTIQQAQSCLYRGEPVFKWDEYWGQWSRILSITMGEHGLYQFREITIGAIMARVHGTQLDKGDYFTSSLPTE